MPTGTQPPPAIPAIRLLRPDALELGADEPCILEISFPVVLPHSLDPSLPKPPYHNHGGLSIDSFRDDHAMSLLRSLMAQVVAGMFGPDYPGAILDANLARPATSKPSDLQLIADYDADAVTDKETGFDFEAGYWKDRHGQEKRGTIHAFKEVHTEIHIIHGFVFYLVRGITDGEKLREMSPRVFRFDVVQDGSEGESEEPAEVGEGDLEAGPEDSELVFEVKEYTPDFRRSCVTPTVAFAMRLINTTPAMDI